MKNAKKMIVAAGFVSLLFASLLPQANGQVVIRGEGLVLFESIDRGVQLSQDSALNFGTIARFSGSGSSLSLTCSSADGDDSAPTAGVLVLTGETPFSCAQFTVKGLSAPSSSFKIKVWVSRILESRSDTNDDTLTPSLFVYGPNDRQDSRLTNIGTSAEISNSIPIDFGVSKSYRIGGELPIPETVSGGGYLGEYTVEVEVQ